MLSLEGVDSHLLVAKLGLQRYRLGVFCAHADTIGVSADAGSNRNGRNCPANCLADPTFVAFSKADTCRSAPITGILSLPEGALAMYDWASIVSGYPMSERSFAEAVLR